MSEKEILTTTIEEKKSDLATQVEGAFKSIVDTTREQRTKIGFPERKTLTKGPYDDESAITKIEETYEPSFVPGVKDKVDRKVFTDQRKLINFIDVRDVLALNNKEIQDEVMAYKGYIPEGTAPGAGKVIPFQGTTIEERIKELNLGQAIAFADKDNKPTAIPYELGLAKYTKAPQGYKAETLFGIPIAQKIQEATGFPLDPIGGKLEYVKRLNDKLIKKGVSARSRYGIIKYRMDKADQGVLDAVFDPAFNDFVNIKGYLKRGVRDVISAPAFILGEVFDVINQEYNKTYTPFGDIADPIPETFIEDSAKRDKFYERFLPEQASLIQDHFANMGVIIDLPTADMLSRDFSNLPSRGIAVGAEIALPTKGMTQIQKLKAVGITGKGGELANYEKFKKDQLKLNKNLTDDQLVKAYSEMRATQIGKTDMFSPVFELPVIGSIGKKINGFVNGGKLATGFDIKMATEAVKGRNPAILASQNRLDSAVLDIENFKSKYRNKEMDVIAQKELQRLESVVKAEKISHRAIVHAEHIPKFMRDVAGQNKYMVVGSAAAGQLAENTEGDVAIFEMIGLFSGLVYSQGRTFRATMRAMKNNIGRETTTDARKTFDLAQQMAENINTFSPDFRDALLARIRYFDELQQNLIKSGVDERLVSRSFSRLSGLTILQTLEEAERLDMSSKDLRHFSNLENLQGVVEEKQKLISELAGISTKLATLPKSKMDDAVVDQFYNVINESLTYGQARLDKLRKDIQVVEDNFKLRVESFIKGDTEIVPAIGEDSVLQFNDALESLYQVGVKKVNLKSIAEQVKKTSDTSKAVANSVTTAVNKINSQHSLQETLLLAKKVTGRKDITAKKKTIPAFEKGGNLLAVLLENNKNKSYHLSRTNYKVLDNTNFVDRLGNEVGRGAKADGTLILRSIFQNADLIDFKDIANTSINQSKRARVLKALEGVGDETLEQIRKGTNQETIMETVNGLLAEARQAGFTLNKRLSPKLQALDYLSQADNVRTINLNFDQLNELKHSVNKLAYESRSANNREATRALEGLSSTIMDTFKTFKVVRVEPDGKRVVNDIKELFVEVDGKRISALDFLKQGDAKYKRHMERFYENPVVSDMLGLGKKGARKRTEPNGDYPVGIIYGKDPLTWFDFNKISKMNPSADGAIFNKKINEGFGTLDNQLNVPRINVDTDEGKAVQKAVQLKASEWLIDKYKEKKLSFNELKDLTDNITANLQGVNSKGKNIALVNFDDIIDNKIGFAPQNIGEDVFKSAKTRAETKINSELRKVRNQVKELERDTEKTLEIVNRYASQKMDSKNIVQSLLGGGETRLLEVRDAMRKSGINGNNVNKTLENLLITEIDKSTFEKTGRLILGGKDGNSLVPEYNMDVQTLKELIGFQDKDKGPLVASIIGRKKYNFYKNMIEFLENESLRTVKNANFTGIPRNLSVESYISRFYSINRGVVSARYVGTEAVLQQYRLRNHSMFKALMLNEEAGQLFLKMVKSGKPLNPKEDIRFGNLMAVMLAKGVATYEEYNRAVDINLGDGQLFRIDSEIRLRQDPRIKSAFQEEFDKRVRGIPLKVPFSEDGKRIIDLPRQ